MTLLAKISYNHGNRCGHDRNVLRMFLPPSEHKPRPYIIRKCQAAITKLWANPFFLEDLPYIINDNDKATPRQRRTESREAIIATLGVLLHYLDLDSLQIRYTQHSSPCVLAFIAERANLSLDRVKSALSLLREGGYIQCSERQWKRLQDGNFKALATIRTLSYKLFRALGVSEYALKMEQGKKRKRMLREKTEQIVKATRDYFESDEGMLDSPRRKTLEMEKQLEAILKVLGTDAKTFMKFQAYLRKPPD
jgi:hypothetical protein